MMTSDTDLDLYLPWSSIMCDKAHLVNAYLHVNCVEPQNCKLKYSNNNYLWSNAYCLSSTLYLPFY